MEQRIREWWTINFFAVSLSESYISTSVYTHSELKAEVCREILPLLENFWFLLATDEIQVTHCQAAWFRITDFLTVCVFLYLYQHSNNYTVIQSTEFQSELCKLSSRMNSRFCRWPFQSQINSILLPLSLSEKWTLTWELTGWFVEIAMHYRQFESQLHLIKI